MRLTRIALSVAWVGLAVLTLVAGGCGSDSGTGPGGGGGGNLATLPAGQYNVSFNASACPPGGPINLGGETFDAVLCQPTSFQELFDIDCQFSQAGSDSLSIDCTFTESDGTCSANFHIVGGGKKVGNTWVIEARQEVSNEIPPNCSGEPPCQIVTITIMDMAPGSGAPSACTYANSNTVKATVSGGPLSGQTLEMFAFGNASSAQPNEWQWNISAYYDSSDPGGPIPTATIMNLAGMGLLFPPIQTSALPISFGVDIVQGFNRTAPGLGNVQMNYNEQYLNGGGFFAESATSGNFTVREMTGDYIAGDYTVAIAGSQFTPPSSFVPSSRTLSGGFYAFDTPIVANQRVILTENPVWPGYAEAWRMIREMR